MRKAFIPRDENYVLLSADYSQIELRIIAALSGEEIINLILEGINEADKEVTYEIISKETEAIKHAIDNAIEGSFITALSDVVSNAIDIVQDYLDKENEAE